MAKKLNNTLNINDKILNSEQNINQELVQNLKKEKSNKINIQCTETEKLSILSTGSDSIEKASFTFQNDPENTDEKLSIDLNIKKSKGSKTKTQTIAQIIKDNQDSKISSSFSDKHFSIVFDGAKLLTPNVIFSALQYHKYDVFNYKKSWHIIIQRELERLHGDFISGKTSQDLPFFKKNVQLIIVRSAPTLVDEDAVVIMFKYIIDALKRDKNNPYGVLADDNPKIIFKSESFNEKGEPFVGIKLEYIEDAEKEKYTIEKILNH